jgi:uncharacterized protein YggE
MKAFALPLLAAAAAATALTALPAQAQQIGPVPVMEAGRTLLTVSAEGRSTRTPDLAVFSAGVTTQGVTAREALSANSAAMSRVIASLRKAGIAERDIQTSNLNLNPVYAQPRRLPDGNYEEGPQRITGYQVNNTVNVRQRKLDEFGTVIDTLVTAGANQVNGPNFQVENSDAALDEARVSAMKAARARGNLYAQAAGLRIVRIISISESGGYYQPQPMVMMARMAADSAPSAPPVAAGEMQMTANVTVQFELAP